MATETAYPALTQSLPIPKMYFHHSPNSSSSDESPNSHSSSINTTPSSGFMQPWLNTVGLRQSPSTSDSTPGSSIPTPPSSASLMQSGMNMMHPIYMYSSPYFHQYPHNMMYPYSSLLQSQNTTSAIQPSERPSEPKEPTSSPESNPTKITPFAPIPIIPQPHSYSHLTTTPVHQQLPRSDRRNSLSSECSSSPSDTSVNRTDVSVDGIISDSDLSRTVDSGNSSLGSDLSTSISPKPDLVVKPTPVEKPEPVAKVTPEPLYKKKARTNYTPEQVRGLEKVFLETPYPEPEAMEKLSKELEIPEQKLKVWFQNKRARWRRRVQDNKHMAATVPQVYMPPMMSPYGFLPAPAMAPTMAPAMAPANPMSSYYAYQQAAAANSFSNSPMQKYGFPCMY